MLWLCFKVLVHLLRRHMGVALLAPEVIFVLLKEPGAYVWIANGLLATFAVLTIRAKKPSYMQAFMIVFAAIQILGFISSWIFWKQMQWIN
ncbi:unnamed protein product, partial [Mesorhabditis spiculigera]